MHVITRLQIENSSTGDVEATFELLSPEEREPGTWTCDIVEMNATGSKTRSIHYASSFGALRAAIKITEALIARMARQKASTEDLMVDGFPFPDWAGTREVPESVQRRVDKLNRRSQEKQSGKKAEG